MQFWIRAALTAVIAYLLGCFNGAVIISKYVLHDDVRTHGSGNGGLTNFLRTFGGPLTAVVLLTDMLKTVAAVLIGAALMRGAALPAFAQVMPAVLVKYWAGAFCLLGHVFPVTFRFRGGKGVLCGGTVALLADWRVALAAWGAFLIVTALTRYVSLGSCCAGTAFAVSSALVYRDLPVALLAAWMGGMLLWGHRGNFKRLLAGTERKLSFHKRKQGENQE